MMTMMIRDNNVIKSTASEYGVSCRKKVYESLSELYIYYQKNRTLSTETNEKVRKMKKTNKKQAHNRRRYNLRTV